MVGIVAKMDIQEEKKLESCREVSKGMNFIFRCVELGEPREQMDGLIRK